MVGPVNIGQDTPTAVRPADCLFPGRSFVKWTLKQAGFLEGHAMSSLRVLASRQAAQAQTSSKKNQAQHPSPLKSIENRSIENRSSVNRTSVPAYSLENLHIFAPGGVRR